MVMILIVNNRLTFSIVEFPILHCDKTSVFTEGAASSLSDLSSPEVPEVKEAAEVSSTAPTASEAKIRRVQLLT